MTYCGAKGREFYCLLAEGHEGPHMSIDNRSKWQGTPGRPVFWTTQPVTEMATVPADLPNGKSLGYTGIPCDNCGSLNTVRVGKCLQCQDCYAAGECG